MHQYSYTRRYRPVRVAGPIAFGLAGHAGFQAYFEARQRGESPTTWWQYALDAIETYRESLDPFEFAKLRALMIGYTVLWDSIPLHVIAVEKEFSLPLINPETGFASRTFELAGKLDVLVELEDGRIAIIEHKTTSDDALPGSAYRERLQLDGQVTQYFLGAEALGYAPDLVIYDVISKPTQRPKLATPLESRRRKKDGTLYANQRDCDETADEYFRRVVDAIADDPNSHFQRVEVVRIEDELDDYRWDVWEIADSIRRSERTGRAPRNMDACFRFGSPCSFWPVCSKRASLNDPSMYRVAQTDDEELSQQKGSGTTSEQKETEHHADER
jgi:hypothetical protein